MLNEDSQQSTVVTCEDVMKMVSLYESDFFAYSDTMREVRKYSRVFQEVGKNEVYPLDCYFLLNAYFNAKPKPGDIVYRCYQPFWEKMGGESARLLIMRLENEKSVTIAFLQKYLSHPHYYDLAAVTFLLAPLFSNQVTLLANKLLGITKLSVLESILQKFMRLRVLDEKIVLRLLNVGNTLADQPIQQAFLNANNQMLTKQAIEAILYSCDNPCGSKSHVRDEILFYLNHTLNEKKVKQYAHEDYLKGLELHGMFSLTDDEEPKAMNQLQEQPIEVQTASPFDFFEETRSVFNKVVAEPIASLTNRLPKLS